MENNLEEIKRRIEIAEFIGSFIQLTKVGRNFKAPCPFHQEKTPSFIVSPERQIWHCFGTCQEGGDVIKFLMKWENLTFFEALKELADRVGIKLNKANIEDKLWKKKERFYTINALAAEYFQYLLHKNKFGEKGLRFLDERGIDKEIINKFKLGYALNSWDGILRFLLRKKYTQEEIFETGLTVKSERGTYYDRFRSRLIFPIKDTRGNTLGFSGRVLKKDTKEAKYINTPETIIYHKRESLYGIDLAKEAIKKSKNAILVEGEFDVISPYQYGIENIVAIKGSSVTKEQLMLLKRYTQTLTYALDADLTGEEAIKKGIAEAEVFDLAVYTVTFDNAKDPDEAVHKDLTAFKNSLKNRLPFYDFLINLAVKKNPPDDPFNKKRIADEIIPHLSKINNSILQTHYIKKVADILKVNEESVTSLIRKQFIKAKRSIQSTFTKHDEFLSRDVTIQKYLLSLIFQNIQPLSLAEKIFNVLGREDFSIPAYQKIIESFQNYCSNTAYVFDLNQFINLLPKELQSVFDEVYLFASVEFEYKDKDIDKLAYEIKKDSLKRRIAALLSSEDSKVEDVKKELILNTSALKEVEKKLL